jgi:O-antigen/teichoic acid export membrane protein
LIAPRSVSEERRPRLAASTALTFGSYIGASACGLLNALLIARTLGPTGRGEVAFLVTVATMMGFAVGLSGNEATANLAGQRPAARPLLAGAAIALALALGVPGAAVTWLIIDRVPALSIETSSLATVLALSGIPMLVLQTYFLHFARGCYLLNTASIAWMASPLLTLVANLVATALGMLTVTVAVGSWLAGVSASTLGLVLTVVLVRSGLSIPDRRLIREILGFGIRSHLGGLMATGSYRLDQWILGGVGGARALGLYSVAVAWFEGLMHLPRAISAASRPDLVRDSSAAARERAALMFRLCLIGTVPLIGAVVLLAPVLCTVVFGPAFAESAKQLRLLAPGAIGISGLAVFGTALVAQGQPLRESTAMGVGFSVALLCYVLLIPAWGGVGAAVASTLAYVSAGVTAGVLASRTLGVGIGDVVPRVSDARRLATIVRARARRR